MVCARGVIFCEMGHALGLISHYEYPICGLGRERSGRAVSRRDEPAALQVLARRIPAPVYNRLRLGVLRLGPGLRLGLAGMGGLSAVLYRDRWLCVDLRGDGRPVLAWRGFAAARQGLHQPVTCELLVYHPRAGLVLGRALGAMEVAVSARLGLPSCSGPGSGPGQPASVRRGRFPTTA